MYLHPTLLLDIWEKRSLFIENDSSPHNTWIAIHDCLLNVIAAESDEEAASLNQLQCSNFS